MLKLIAAAGLCLVATGYVQPREAAAADGGGSCGGRLIDYKPYYGTDGKKIGQLQLYYNAQNGNNCAILYHGGPTWGKASYTGLVLSTRTRYLGSNKGNFRYQAGPVRANGRGICVAAFGGITYQGSYISGGTPFHCD